MSRYSSLSPHDALLAVIRKVRNRWRLKIALQGSAILVGGTVLLFLISGKEGRDHKIVISRFKSAFPVQRTKIEIQHSVPCPIL